VVAHAETYMGLVEVGVGVVPGWGGCAAMLQRWSQAKSLPKGPIPPVAKAFEMISTAAVSKSAAEAQELMLLRPGDEIVMNRDRLLAAARGRALALVEGYAPAAPAPLRLPGATGRALLGMAVEQFAAQGKVTPHDRVVCAQLANVLTGGDADFIDDTSEDKVTALERRAFMDLLKHPATLARIEHMLETGKPLRN
jgi:3-hydroxyacyl-CoA dehydrogenase